VLELSKEVSALIGLLRAVDKAMRQCAPQRLTMQHIDDDLLSQIDNALTDCDAALKGLEHTIDKIKKSKIQEGFLRKPALQIRINLYKDEISSFSKKFNKSNCAMQTAIAVLNM